MLYALHEANYYAAAPLRAAGGDEVTSCGAVLDFHHSLLVLLRRSGPGSG